MSATSLADETIPLFNRKTEGACLSLGELSEIEQKVAHDLKVNGYSLLPKFIDEALIDQIVADCDGNYSKSERRLPDAFRISASAKSLACDARVVSLLSNVYGRAAFPFQTLNFEQGTEQATHSDTIHFCSMPYQFMTGVWVAFEDVTENNGPLHYYENSHRLPLLTNEALGISLKKRQDSAQRYSEYENAIRDYVELLGLERKEVRMNKGDVFIWSANLLHGGSLVKDKDTTRLSQVTHYFFEDCFYLTPLNSDIKRGKLAVRVPFDVVQNRFRIWEYLATGFRAISPVMLTVSIAKVLVKSLARRITGREEPF
jgi:hypothetical protein